MYALNLISKFVNLTFKFGVKLYTYSKREIIQIKGWLKKINCLDMNKTEKYQTSIPHLLAHQHKIVYGKQTVLGGGHNLQSFSFDCL